MEKKEKESKKLEDKVVEIEDYLLKEEIQEEGQKKEETKEEQEEVKEEKQVVDKEILKERVISIISEMASRGLPEEEKVKFVEEFSFWNERLWELADVGDNLSNILSKNLTLTPGKSLMVYGIGTVALILLLRKDLLEKIMKKQQQPSSPIIKEEF